MNYYQCNVKGSCQRVSTPQSGQPVYLNDPSCAAACRPYYYCDANACVPETSRLREGIVYYKDDPTCDRSCEGISPLWTGYTLNYGGAGVYQSPFPRSARGFWRGGHR